MTLRNAMAIAFGSVLVAASIVVHSAGCLVGNCPDRYLESGKYKLNARSESHYWLNDAILTVDRESGTAKLRYTREGSTYEVTYVLDEYPW